MSVTRQRKEEDERVLLWGVLEQGGQQEVTLATAGGLSIFLLQAASCVRGVSMSWSLLEEGVEPREEGEGEQRG